MKYISGDIWELAKDLNGWIVIPTNTTLRGDGKAVMGAGLAKDAMNRYPCLPGMLGRHVKRFDDRIFVDSPIICMATKRNWRYPSKLKWIEKGCFELLDLARMLSGVKDNRPILVPRLGSGLGGLNWEREVRPVVDLILEGDRFISVSQ